MPAPKAEYAEVGAIAGRGTESRCAQAATAQSVEREVMRETG